MRISDWSSACALPIYNILWGDSFGGLFALHVLFNHPAAYQTYLVGSPSINWSGGAILEDEINLAAQVAAGEVAPRVLFTLGRSEEHTSELQSLMRISYAVFCLKKNKKNQNEDEHIQKIEPTTIQ